MNIKQCKLFIIVHLTTDSTGGAKQMPYNGAPLVPAGIDGMSQFEPEAAGLVPNGKVGSMYGGMGGLPYGGQTPGMGAGKSNAKYGIGGLQFGGQPLNTGTNGAGQYGYGGSPYAGAGKAGKYGGLGAGIGGNPEPAQYGYGGVPNGGQHPVHGSNGYGRMPYEAQPAGISPEAKSAGTYGYGNGYNAHVQPDYASLGQGVPTANGKSGGPKQMPYNGAPIVPAGLDGMSQFEPQTAGLGPNGKLSSMYGGLAASQYQSEPLGHDGKSTGIYGGGEVPYAQQAPVLGGDAKSYGKYGNQGQYQPQPHDTASEDAGLPYEPLPLQPDSALKSYGASVEGELHAPEIAVEGEGMSLDRYDNVGYINGEVQPEVVAFPAVPTSSPTMAYPSDPSYVPVEVFSPAAGVEDLPLPAGTDDLILDSAPATETQGGAYVPEQPEDLLHQQEMPRQIHIQQHLKLHFHPKEGAKTRKYDLNGFLGNSGYQG
ncbi:calymmin [Eleginops maclovinus]|uniref:calymmin n=1 Tax=Eleginops maclovinus TaxID=56733 RepID=UPI00307FEDD6